MLKCIVKLFVCFCSVVLMSACSSTNNKPLLIDFSADSSAIVFSHIEQAGLLQLQQLNKNDTALHGLIAVLQSPSEQDTTLKETPVEGKILVTDSNLVFVPVSPLVKGRHYLVITHLNTRFGGAAEILKGELANRLRPAQKLLRR